MLRVRRMIRHPLSILLLLALAVVGCQNDRYARQLVQFDTGYGKVSQTLTGTPEQLIEQKRIDMHRRVTMDDKIVIDAWVIKAAPPSDQFTTSSGTVVVLHGLLDSKAGYLSLGQRLSKLGYDVILIDLRAHGASGGQYVTYGAMEKNDVKAVVDALLKESAARPPVYAFGVSLGGATAIQYAAIDPRCKGVMAIAPYADARDIAKWMMALSAPLMSNAEFDATLDQAGKLAHFNPAEVSSVEAAKKLTCPLLLVHGQLDGIVPVDQSQAVYDATKSPKQLIIVPWAGHKTIMLAREDWVAEQIDHLARTGLATPAEMPEEEE